MSEASRLMTRGAQPTVEAIAHAAGVSRTTFYRVFPSRTELLQALDLEPEPDTRQRVLEAALRLLQTHSLADLSMDELASRSGISRANLYRLYPGKPALFRAILLAFSPFTPVMALFARSGNRPAEELIPELVRTAYRTVAGRTGVLRTVLAEVTAMSGDSQAAFRETGLRAFAMLGRYLDGEMAAGRLRPMPPMLAVQSLIGPIMLLILAGPLLGQAAPGTPAGEEAAMLLATNWLRGMRPEV